MTLQELIDLTRHQLRDYEDQSAWLDSELVAYCNNAINTIARHSMPFEDALDPSTCFLTLAPDTIDYALSNNIVAIISTSISGYVGTITQSGVGLSDISVCGNYTHDDTDTAFKIQIDGTGATNTFKWSDDGGATWDASTVSMTGSWQLLSHGIYIKFAAITGHTNANYWTFTTYYVNGPILTRYTTQELYENYSNWRKGTSGEPTHLTTDYSHGYISFYVPPQYAYLVNMRVKRYPLSQLTTTLMSAQTPEIPAAIFHHRLIDGIMAEAYLKSGADTYDKDKAAIHRGLFLSSISEILRTESNIQSYRRSGIPHNGTL